MPASAMSGGMASPDIVLVKGRQWQVTTLTFFGDSKGSLLLRRGRRFRAMRLRVTPALWPT